MPDPGQLLFLALPGGGTAARAAPHRGLEGQPHKARGPACFALPQPPCPAHGSGSGPRGQESTVVRA